MNIMLANMPENKESQQISTRNILVLHIEHAVMYETFCKLLLGQRF
jgi:hypothetical protein